MGRTLHLAFESIGIAAYLLIVLSADIFMRFFSISVGPSYTTKTLPH